MSLKLVLVAAAGAAVLVPAAAQRAPKPWTPAADWTATEMASPAPAGSAQPQLAVSPDGRIVLSWLEQGEGRRHRFRLAARRGDTWAAPVTIAEADDFFVNWADVPSVIVLPDGTLAAHWLVSTGPRTQYDVKVALSTDAGRTWSTPVVPHRDGTKTEHGFVSFFPSDKGAGLIWLDGRDFAGHGDMHGSEAGKAEMALRSADVWAGGAGPEQVVDPRVCECCPTAAALTDRGVVVAYRDRSPEEIRDIYVARRENGRWLAPRRVHADNWQLAGCPVNGPALAADGRRVAIAWFTAADNTARVNVAFSNDGGERFGAPVRMNDGIAHGRVGIALLPDGSAVASWIDHNDGNAELYVRRVERGGAQGPIVRVAPISSDRRSGYPRLARSDDELFVAWTATEGRPQVRVARIRIGDK